MSFTRKSMRLLKKTKRNLLISILSIVFCSLVFWSDVLVPFEPVANIPCHNIDSNITSFPVLHTFLKLPTRSIFFHVASCPGNLTSREYCAIESTSRSNPEWQINIVFSHPVSTDTFLQENLKNVKFWRVHTEEFLKGTPFEKFYNIHIREKCKLGALLSRDVMKYLTLGIWGGIYLDLDMVVVRPLGSLVRNWATRNSDDSLGEGVLALSSDAVGRNVSKIAIKEMQMLLSRRVCRSQRSSIITNALRSFCSTPDAVHMSAATCTGFEVYGPQFFHPIPESRAREYFVSGEVATTNAYTYHFWDHITKNHRVMRTSPFAKLAKRYCPSTFKMYSNQFGL